MCYLERKELVGDCPQYCYVQSITGFLSLIASGASNSHIGEGPSHETELLPQPGDFHLDFWLKFRFPVDLGLVEGRIHSYVLSVKESLAKSFLSAMARLCTLQGHSCCYIYYMYSTQPNLPNTQPLK